MGQSAKEKNPPFPRHYAEEFLVIDHGEGVYLFDRAGNRYLDFASGISVNSLGYGRTDIADVAAAQMKKLIHISNLFTTQPALELAQKLTATKDFAAVHFGNSGSEANEAALKYARLYSLRVKGEGCSKFLAFTAGFHGRTMGALSTTYKNIYRDPFSPLIDGVTFLPFNDSEALKNTLDDSYAAVIVEPLQGEGGLNLMTKEFAATMNVLCEKHKVIIIADEIQCGMGRTGALFTSDLVGLNPDIVTLSKPLAAGLPLSATLIPEKINDLIRPGEHGGTFGGGPVTTAVANYIFDLLTEPSFLKSVQEKGAYLTELLQNLVDSHPKLGEVKGLGLLQGISILENPAENKVKIYNKCHEEGLLALTAGTDIVRLAPPLIVEKEQLREGVEILTKVIKEIL